MWKNMHYDEGTHTNVINMCSFVLMWVLKVLHSAITMSHYLAPLFALLNSLFASADIRNYVTIASKSIKVALRISISVVILAHICHLELKLASAECMSIYDEPPRHSFPTCLFPKCVAGYRGAPPHISSRVAIWMLLKKIMHYDLLCFVTHLET